MRLALFAHSRESPAGGVDICARLSQEIARAREALLEYRAGAAGDADAPGSDRFEREVRFPDRFAQHTGQRAEALKLADGDPNGVIALAAKSCNGTRDRVVQAPVQRTKVAGGDRRRCFNGEIGDGLTDVAP
jgi:hypothetical protein